MADNGAFTMSPGEKSTLRAFINVTPPFIVALIVKVLMDKGLLPYSPAALRVLLIVCLLLLAVLFINKKKHTLRVERGRIIEQLSDGTSNTIPAAKISRVKKLPFTGVLLLDSEGKRLLLVESYMTNYSKFLRYLKELGL